MTKTSRVDEADRILDELEAAARSPLPNRQFWEQVVESLRILVQAEATALAIPVHHRHWVAVASSGPLDSECLASLGRHGSAAIGNEGPWGFEPRPRSGAPATDTFALGPQPWYAIPLHPEGPGLGCLVVQFTQQPSASGLQALGSLGNAFAEVVAIRQADRSERLYGVLWNKAQQLALRLSHAPDAAEAAKTLVDQLVPLLQAARVSLVASPWAMMGRPKVAAVSGAGTVDHRGLLAQALVRLGQKTCQQEQPLLNRSASVGPMKPATDSDQSQGMTDDLFENRLAIQFHDAQEYQSPAALIVEWVDLDSMMDAFPAVTLILPALSTIWNQQCRWLQIPVWARAGQRSLMRPLSWSWFRWALKPFVLLSCLTGLAFLLNFSSPLIIECEAVLEPVDRRGVYAHVDAHLDQLYVEDGDDVKPGQLLVTLRSPSLDAEIEETTGQMRALAEKHKGLKVAINQLSPSDPDAVSSQTRIASELLVLETQQKFVREKLDFLSGQRARLAITSPIAGVVVAKELRRDLESRPFRRGDTLFHVIDLNGDWRLRIQLADRDYGYVASHYRDFPKSVAFVFDSLPDQRFEASVQEIGQAVENPKGEGCFVPVLASVTDEAVQQTHMGATARVSFSCGTHPLWFVWCRPLVEAIQKRYWLYFQGGPSETKEQTYGES